MRTEERLAVLVEDVAGQFAVGVVVVVERNDDLLEVVLGDLHVALSDGGIVRSDRGEYTETGEETVHITVGNSFAGVIAGSSVRNESDVSILFANGQV